MTTWWVALAGGVGAGARFVVDGYIRQRWGGSFPWATLLINVSGSLVLGVLTGWVLFHAGAETVLLIAGTGFCGGYTTFSTATFESVRLLQQRRWWQAAGAIIGSLLLCAAAAAAGLAAAKAL